jgi:hypothetical protein
MPGEGDVMAIQIGFGWNPQRSAYQNMKTQRTRVANYASSVQSGLSAASNLFASAATNQISGMAKLAAQQAVTRMQAKIKEVTASREKQLAQAQATLQATQAAYNSSSLGKTDPSGNVLNTSA